MQMFVCFIIMMIIELYYITPNDNICCSLLFIFIFIFIFIFKHDFRLWTQWSRSQKTLSNLAQQLVLIVIQISLINWQQAVQKVGQKLQFGFSIMYAFNQTCICQTLYLYMCVYMIYFLIYNIYTISGCVAWVVWTGYVSTFPSMYIKLVAILVINILFEKSCILTILHSLFSVVDTQQLEHTAFLLLTANHNQ